MHKPSDSKIYEFEGFRLDEAQMMLYREGKEISLPPRAVETLIALLERRGEIISKAELMESIWSGSIVEESNLSQYIHLLRKALGSTASGQPFIETFRRRGYRFNGDVEVARRSAGSAGNTRENGPGATPVPLPSLQYDPKKVVALFDRERRSDKAHTTTRAGTDRAPATIHLSDRTDSEVAPARHTGLYLAIGAGALLAVTLGLLGYRSGWASSRADPFRDMQVSRVTASGVVTHAAISPDGRYVAHVVNDANGNSLWVKNMGTPSDVRIAGLDTTEYISARFTPDSTTLYYVALDHDKGQSTLYRISVMGGTPAKITDDVYPLGFSPDGHKFAFIRFQRSESRLVVSNSDGSDQRDLAKLQKPDYFKLEWNAPAWSPDGKTIACPVGLNDRQGRYETIVGMDASDGAISPLTRERWQYVGQPVWLRDGSGLLLTASDRPGAPMQIWHLTLADGGATQITHDLNNYKDLTLTADGSRLSAVQVQTVSNIWVAPDSKASIAKQIRSEVGSLEGVAWTPDNRIVYRSSAGGEGSDIWIMNADGSNAKQMTTGARVGRGVAVTPDGAYIVFSSDKSGRFNLWRMDIGGGDLRQLTAGDGEFYPSCTPDGRSIVYQSNEVIDPRLWKVTIDGGEPVQLMNTRGMRPAVSPDGQTVAYSYLDIDLEPNRWGIGLVSSAGGERSTRFDFPASVAFRGVRWAPDGSAIAFVNSPGGLSDIWLQPLDGSGPRPLTDFRSEQILAFDWSRDSHSLALIRTRETSDVILFEHDVRALR